MPENLTSDDFKYSERDKKAERETHGFEQREAARLAAERRIRIRYDQKDADRLDGDAETERHYKNKILKQIGKDSELSSPPPRFKPGEEPQYLGPDGKSYSSMEDVREARAKLNPKIPKQPLR